MAQDWRAVLERIGSRNSLVLTRKVRDASGHEHAADGKFGTGGGSGSAATKEGNQGKQSKPDKQPSRGSAAWKKAKELVGRAIVAGQNAGAAVKRAITAYGNDLWAEMTPKEQAVATKVYKAVQAVEHKLESFKSISQAMVEAVATERGYSPEIAQRAAKVCKIVDLAAAWTTNIPAVHAGLHAVDVTGVGGFILAKVGYYIPVASLGYLAYSTARNPKATVDAARKIFGGKGDLAGSHKAGLTMTLKSDTEEGDTEGVNSKAAVEALMEAIKAAGDQHDWYLALLSAALDTNGHDLADAVTKASAALKENPTPPTNETEKSDTVSEASKPEDKPSQPAWRGVIDRIQSRGTDSQKTRMSLTRKSFLEDMLCPGPHCPIKAASGYGILTRKRACSHSCQCQSCTELFTYRTADDTIAQVSLNSSSVVTDDGEMSAVGILCSSNRDRQGDIIEASGVVFDDHKWNPVAMWDHGKQYGLPIGKTESADGEYTVRYLPGDDIITQKTYFANTPFAKQIYTLIRERFIRANSIAVKDLEVVPLPPDESKGLPPRRNAEGRLIPYKHILRSSLAEVTWTPLPANPDAVASMLGRGRIMTDGANTEPLHPLLYKSLLPFVPRYKVWANGFMKERGRSRG